MQAVNNAGQEHSQGNTAAAAVAEHHAPPLYLAETAVEDAGHLALSPQSLPGLALHLHLGDTQAEQDPPQQADAAPVEASLTIIPDTVEPCSNSKETPKSKQQTAQGDQEAGQAPEQRCSQGASVAEQVEEPQRQKQTHASPKSVAEPPEAPKTAPRLPLQNPVKRWITMCCD